jgi:hypothetical protein
MWKFELLRGYDLDDLSSLIEDYLITREIGYNPLLLRLQQDPDSLTEEEFEEAEDLENEILNAVEDRTQAIIDSAQDLEETDDGAVFLIEDDATRELIEQVLKIEGIRYNIFLEAKQA